MATEVTVTIQGKSVQHALFISEAEQSLSLSALRELITNQEIDLPREYKFLTRSGNAISPVSELTLTLSDISVSTSTNKQTCSGSDATSDVKREESETSTCDAKNGLKKEAVSKEATFEIKVIPISCLESESSGESEAEHQNSTGHTQGQGQGMASACPWIMIKHCMTDHPKPAVLFKIILAILLTLITLLISLTLSLKLMMSLTSGLMNEAPIADLFQRFIPPAGDAEALTDLKVKFSQLEVTHKFEIQDLKNKLNELEDLYLRDMAHLKEEVAELRHLQKTFEGSYNLAKDALTTVNNQLAAQVKELASQLQNQMNLQDGKVPGEKDGESHKKKDKEGEKKQKMLKVKN